MKTEKKYEQWKAITESDFVTLFIKTWFTYIGLTEKANAHQKKRRKQETMGENSTILPRDVV